MRFFRIYARTKAKIKNRRKIISGKFKELSNKLSLAFRACIGAEKIANGQKKHTHTQTYKKTYTLLLNILMYVRLYVRGADKRGSAAWKGAAVMARSAVRAGTFDKLMLAPCLAVRSAICVSARMIEDPYSRCSATPALTQAQVRLVRCPQGVRFPRAGTLHRGRCI